MKLKLTPGYGKTRDEIWENIFEHLADDAPVSRNVRIFDIRHALFIAASLTLILVLSARFYTIDVFNPRASQKVILLPDNSEALLNAESKISYHPFWWRFKRALTLEGEAFFNVKKGNAFDVTTTNGAVEVLGTSFNVFSRGNRFEIFCKTGRVRVSSGKSEVTLKAMEQSHYTGKELAVEKVTSGMHPAAWIDGQFSFNKTPLFEVIQELERQYNIQIVMPEKVDYLYSGNFSKKKDPKEILHIIGAPFGITLSIAPQK